MNLDINQIDQSNLRQVILDYPNQMELGKKFAKDIKLEPKKYSNLVICGMGGSALPGDILLNYLSNNPKFTLPVYLCRSYDLPVYASKNSLIFISSYSGNTEETIACLEQAMKLKATIVTFSQAGKIKELALKNGLSHVSYKIQFPDFQPRYATTYAFIAMYQVLENCDLVEKLPRFPQINPRDLEIYGEELAKKSVGKTPIIYTADHKEIVAKIWKIKINENAKTPAFYNVFPELNHNEMVGFTNPQSKFLVLIISDSQDHARVKRRMEITAELLKNKGVAVEFVNIPGNNYFEQLLNALVLGDWVSYYLAIEYNQDPTPVKMVEDLKQALG